MNTRRIHSTKSKTKAGPEPTSYEVFRNNTTSVEVVVKELANEKDKTAELDESDPTHVHDAIIRKQQNEITNLKGKLEIATARFDKVSEGYRQIIDSLKRRLDETHSQDGDVRAKKIVTELENEKLKAVLGAKTDLVAKLKKELVELKRTLKFVIKSINCVPQALGNFTLGSDPDYDEFEKDLKKNTYVKFASVVDGAGLTFDSTKDVTSFDNVK